MIKYKNRYLVTLQTNDQRVWQVKVKADYMNDDGFIVRFWNRHGPFGLLRTCVHYIQADVLVSVVKDD